MNLLLKNIAQLLCIDDHHKAMLKGKEMGVLPAIQDAYLLIQNGLIADYGAMQNCPEVGDIKIIDATRRTVLPTWVDSHTHLVYAYPREGEFVDRLKGLTYVEIAEKGGGILNSAKRLQQTSEDELYESAKMRLHEIIGMGTGAVEIKSGYGLTLEDELKMLRVARRLAKVSPIEIKTNFLGAHAIPKEYTNRKDYVDLIVDKMLPKVAEENLADYVDVFCDKGFFTPEETDRILKKGAQYGLRPKIHANELDYSGGIQIGVQNNALSVDHLEFTGDAEIEVLRNSETMPTLLPSTAFFLGLHYPPARKMIDAGLPVALATDYNPGSSPSGKMAFVISLACFKMKMLPEEAIQAATLNSAYAMGLEKTHGSICKGKVGNVIITKPNTNAAFIPYAFGSDLVEEVVIGGEVFVSY